MNRFRPLFSTALALVILAGTPVFVRHAEAQAASQPLVVVRFNQARVYYDQQLYSAISQAVSVKPDVIFDVVSNAPVTGDSRQDDQWITTASRNTQAVVAVMKSFGVPMERMRITGKATPGIRYDETQIYAH